MPPRSPQKPIPSSAKRWNPVLGSRKAEGRPSENTAAPRCGRTDVEQVGAECGQGGHAGPSAAGIFFLIRPNMKGSINFPHLILALLAS